MHTSGITTQYEKKHLAHQRKLKQKLEDIYEEAIRDLAILAAAQAMPKGTFSLAKVPILKQRVDESLKQMRRQITATVQNGILAAWLLSKEKNDLITDLLLGGLDIPDRVREVFYAVNEQALDTFLTRSIKGLNLSERIWKTVQPFKYELESALAEGISEGRSAVEMARDIKQYLKEPNKLFRRVRVQGVLRLSKAAEAYHPGQGVYRSSFKNAWRVSRTEVNMAYRNADMERWQRQPFVLGYEVKLSKSHPTLDICDHLKGRYPASFVFTGWHPQCLCFCVPILMNDAQMQVYTKLIISGGNTPNNIAKIPGAGRVTDVPQGLKDWLVSNADRIKRWKSNPWWMGENGL